MKSILIFSIFLSIAIASCGKKQSLKAMHDTPSNLVNAIFDAAKSGDLSSLSDICPPNGECDSDSKDICNAANEHTEEFKHYFSKGKIVGDPVISGDQAEVHIKFGPDGETEETINLIKIDGKWYLKSL